MKPCSKTSPSQTGQMIGRPGGSGSYGVNSLTVDTLMRRQDPSSLTELREADQRCCACCLIRLVSSVTWLNTLRRSDSSPRIFLSACITVVWSRPPNC